jgi:uncharacterized protein YodC (DUF2158 family)
MSEHQFKAGEKVRLKSGGPDMAVESVGTKEVMCVWFEGTKLQRDTFVPETLELVPPKESTSSFIRRA